MSSGLYLSVVRDGIRESIAIEDLTPEEFQKQFDGRSAEELTRWVDSLRLAVRQQNEEIVKLVSTIQEIHAAVKALNNQL